MDELQTNGRSLFEAVRSRLTLESDSGFSASEPASAAASAHPSPLRPGTATDEDVVQHLLALRRELAEPFPDYEDISVDPEFDVAYLRAFHLAVQDRIRTEIVDPSIEEPQGLHGPKMQTLNAIKAALAHPQLSTPTRGRFIALTNMVIRLENVLFSGREFLNNRATNDAQHIATIMLTYVSWVETVMKGHYETSSLVYEMLNIIAAENVPERIRYQRMSLIVNWHVKKPRPAEQRLLALYEDLFNEWIHTEFLNRRDAQIGAGRDLNNSRIQLAQSVHAISGGLSSANHNYNNYKGMLITMRDQLFVPSLLALPSHIVRTLPAPIQRCDQMW
ncbi:hypothetical protein N7540_007059 [Penicillium herquei]|nr:hypothetical protein N7540_007059 [Penicillium herquei]